jgi:amino acid permease
MHLFFPKFSFCSNNTTHITKVMAIAGVMYITFGATCYLAFGEVVSDEILGMQTCVGH